MRTIVIPGTDIRTSPIGLGCASLGSRISPTLGRRMLEAAFEGGVTWYDVAPSYGAGRAEEILAPFVAAHRDDLYLCSKAGLVPPKNNGLMRLAYDLGRPLVSVARGLSRRFRSIKATRNRRVALNGDFPDAWPGAWKCADNTFLTITTVAEWKEFYGAMVAAGSALYAHAQELKAALSKATTFDEIAAVVW